MVSLLWIFPAIVRVSHPESVPFGLRMDLKCIAVRTERAEALSCRDNFLKQSSIVPSHGRGSHGRKTSLVFTSGAARTSHVLDRCLSVTISTFLTLQGHSLVSY